jgi:hypothetical protein
MRIRSVVNGSPLDSSESDDSNLKDSLSRFAVMNSPHPRGLAERKKIAGNEAALCRPPRCVVCNRFYINQADALIVLRFAVAG